MSLTPEAQRKVIDYYFEEPNAKAVVEDGLGSNIQDVRDFLEAVYEFLIKLHPGFVKSLEIIDLPSREPGDVGMGQGATTADLEAISKRRKNPGLNTDE
jgi:hypothetical protein